MKQIKKQAGMSMWGWMFVLFLVGLTGLQGLRLFTPVSDYFALDSIVQKVKEDMDSGALEMDDVYRRMNNAAQINSLNGFKADKNSVEFKETRDKMTMRVFYQQSVDYFWDIDLVLTYDKTIELKK